MKIRYLKRLIPIIILTSLISGCNKGVESPTGTEPNITLSKTEKQEYIDRVNEVMDNNFNWIPATGKLEKQSEILYQMLFTDRADIIEPTLNVSDEEINSYLNVTSNKNIKQKLTLDKGDGNTWDYLIYTDDTSSYQVGDSLLGYKIIEINDPTEEERTEYARKSVLAQKMVDEINREVEDILR